MGREQGQAADVKMETLSMKYITSGLVGFLFSGAIMSVVYAENGYFTLGQGSQQLEISANKVNITDRPEEGKTAEGNVKVVQGNITLTCDKLVIAYNPNNGAAPTESHSKKPLKNWLTDSNIKSFTASGNVKIIQDERTATAGKAFLDTVNRIITLTDSPRIWQGRDAGIADAIIMYLDENRWEFRGGDDSPIKFTIHPGDQKNGKKKESPHKRN
jgi:lipopolysaccharide export system protein LptA